MEYIPDSLDTKAARVRIERELSSYTLQQHLKGIQRLKDTEQLTPAEIALYTGALYDVLRAPALYDTIYKDENGSIVVDGTTLEDEEQERFIQMAKDAKANRYASTVRKLISRKVEYAAVIMTRNATTPYDLVFAKAALWAVQQIDLVYDKLLGEARPGSSLPAEEEPADRG